MSLFDESFPADIFHTSSFTNQCHETKNNNNSLIPIITDKDDGSLHERSSLSLNENEEDMPSSSSTMTGPISTMASSSDRNSEEKSTDDSKETTTNSGNSDEKIDNGYCKSFGPTSKCKIISKMKNFANHKSKSYQDLHSDYTKKKYQHVQSKVQKYIADMKAEDNRRKYKLKINRHGSMPETMNNDCYSSAVAISTEPENVFQRTLENLNQNNLNKISGKNNLSVDHKSIYEKDQLLTIIYERDQLLTEFRNRNDYLQSNLDDKIALAARYKRNADHLQVELLLLKEREKRLKETNNYNRYNYSYRSSLPTSGSIFSTGKVTASTQTDLLPNKFDIHNVEYLNFSDSLDFLKLNGSFGRGGNKSKKKIDSMLIFNQDGEITNDNVEIIPPSHSNNNNNVVLNLLRRRSNSNSMKLQKNNSNTKLNIPDENGTSSSSISEKSLVVQVHSQNNGSDSAIESDGLFQIDDYNDEDGEDIINNNIDRRFSRNFKCTTKSTTSKILLKEEKNNGTTLRRNKIKKKRIYKKIFLKSFFGSCIKCCKDNNNNNDAISYKEISISDSKLVSN